MADPQSQGLEDAIVDVVASQVSRVNHFSRINALSEIRRLDIELVTELDTLSELGEIDSINLQKAMDRLSAFLSVMSRALQKIGATQTTIVSSFTGRAVAVAEGGVGVSRVRE